MDKPPFAFVAFSGGRHKCLGNAFAILRFKTILAILLQCYEVSLTSDPIEPDFHGLVIGSKAPVRVGYRRILEDELEQAEPQPAAQSEVEAVAQNPAGGPADTSGPAKTSGTAPGAPIRIVVDYDVSQGHGACELEPPDVVKVDKGGQMTVLMGAPTKADWDKIHEGVRQCPQRALSLVEIKTK